MDRPMDGVDPINAALRLPGGAEDDIEAGGQRATQAAERVLSEGGVLSDCGGDRRVCDLHQQGA